MKSLVFSASRRTDIPAFYLQWFLSSLKNSSFLVQNPFSKKIQKIEFYREEIHSIVFWSKNYRELIKNIEKLRNFNLYFHFTINSEDRVLQPNVPPVDETLLQLEFLAKKFSPSAISWRFDPIVFYEKDGKIYNNLKDFEKIALKTKKLGINSFITSFMSYYPKVFRREKNYNIKFIYPSIEEKVEHLKKLAQVAESFSLKVYLCCEKELVKLKIKNTFPASCINVEHLISLYGEGASIIKDKSQRISKGCGCHFSIDIGSYGLQPCLCGCLYCYANPK